MKHFKAMVWPEGDDKPERRVFIEAASLEDAKTWLEDKYGKGRVFDLHDEDEAKRPR